jgi:ankyrin repeat protein
MVIVQVGASQYTDGNGDTALHVACETGNVQVVKIMLITANKPAKIFRQMLKGLNKNKKTPFLLAVSRGHEEVVEILLNTKRLNSVELGDGLEDAAKQGYTEIMRMILEYTSGDLPDAAYNRALIACTENGHVTCLRELQNNCISIYDTFFKLIHI